MKNEYKKSNRNVSMVDELMSASYAMRHCELPYIR